MRSLKSHYLPSIQILSKTTDSPKQGMAVPIFPFDTYDVYMKKLLPVLAISALLLTGCATPENKPKYDEVDLIKYESCLKLVIEKTDYRLTDGLTMSQVMKKIDGYCDSVKPQKK